MLFIIYSKHTIREELDGWKCDITIGGRKRYADDIVLLVASKKELQYIMKKLKVVGLQQ